VNQIGGQGAQALSVALQRNSSLHRLNLLFALKDDSEESETKAAALQILHGISINVGLEWIDIGGAFEWRCLCVESHVFL